MKRLPADASPSRAVGEAVADSALDAWARTPWAIAASGAFGFVLSFAWSWVPSFWRDETATAHMANRPVAEIAQVVENIDVVFAFYYYLMHAWVDLAGTTALTLRLPSAVAVGVGAAAVTAVGRRLVSPTFGVLAGVVFAALPRMTAMGSEARSYALSAAAVAVVGLVALHMVDRPRVWLVALYAAVGTAAVYFHLYAVLAIGAICLSGIVLARARRARVALGVASAVVLAGSVPLLLASLGQAEAQVSWIQATSPSLLEQVGVEQYVPFKTVVRFVTPDQAGVRVVAAVLAALAWSLVAVLVVTGWRRYRRLLVFGVPGVVLPTALVLTYSLAVTPAYVPRYLVATAPAFALLLAGALHSLRRTWLRVTVVGVLVALWLPVYVMQRQPFAKFVVDDYAFIAQAVGARAEPGDGILFDAGPEDPVESGRNALAGYPSSFEGITDIAEVLDDSRLRAVWTPQRPLGDVVEEITEFDRIWLVTIPPSGGYESEYAAVLAGLGYERVEAVVGPTHEVQLWLRT